MEYYSTHINKLIEQLSHLPGIGAKSAQRLGFPYYEHAEGPGGTAYGLHHRSKGKGEVLQRVLHSDGSGTVSHLRQFQAGSSDDHGCGKHERSGRL